MVPVEDRDINQGYVRFIRSISLKSTDRKRGLFHLCRSLVRDVVLNSLRVSFIPLLFLYGVLLTLFLNMTLLLLGKRDLPELHKKAIAHIPEFISQYPMHAYPIVAKSMELVFLRGNIRQVVSRVKRGVVELAIGEGTFSKRIFSTEDKLVGFDLNPYSLVHTKKYGHIVKRVVSDCRNPPVGMGGASFIVCNNFLHHITDKENVVRNWAQMAPYAIFNENTDYWASGWVKPFILKRMGLHRRAEKEARTIEDHSMQTLWKKEELRSLIHRYYTIEEELSFFSEKVFFLSAVCSALLLCYGPPTPLLQKKVMNRLLGPFTRRLTYSMAKALIETDAMLPRNKDAFICWLGKSRAIGESSVGDDITLVCPDCRGVLQGNQCPLCHRTFEEKDGMLFLLPEGLVDEIAYSSNQSNQLKEEHL